MSLAVLLKINYYDGWTLRHRKLLKNYLVAVIASNKRLLARFVFCLINCIIYLCHFCSTTFEINVLKSSHLRQALLLMHRLTQLGLSPVPRTFGMPETILIVVEISLYPSTARAMKKYWLHVNLSVNTFFFLCSLHCSNATTHRSTGLHAASGMCRDNNNNTMTYWY